MEMQGFISDKMASCSIPITHAIITFGFKTAYKAVLS